MMEAPLAPKLLDDRTLARLAYYERASRAIAYARSRLSERIPLEAVAFEAGMNASAFSRYFTDKIGVSFFAVLRALRIERALRELERRDCSIEYLAETTGYRNATTFSRAFKQAIGETPTEYRRRLLGFGSE